MSFGRKSFVSHNVDTHPLLKLATYVLMEIICQSQCRHRPSLLKTATYPLQSKLPHACICRSDGNHLSVTMSKPHTLLKSATYVLQSNRCGKRELSCGWESFVSHNVESRNTPSSEIGDIRAAIESVAPIVQCRSDGNHILSITMSKVETHMLLSLTYALHSNQLRQACIVVRMDICQSHQSKHTPSYHNVRATIKPVAPSVHCHADGNYLSVTMTTLKHAVF
jgi:hypothetical protein